MVKKKKRSKKKTKKPAKVLLGWNEWISIPSLGVDRIKVKVDTGARTSALHAEEIKVFRVKGKRKRYVRFKIFPLQRSKKEVVVKKAELVEKRSVTSSIGKKTIRPVIRANVKIGDVKKEIEITLVNRDVLGYRMLLGRTAIRGSHIVDPGRSCVLGK